MANRLTCKIQFSDEITQDDIITPTQSRFEDKYTTHETLGQGAHAVVKKATKNSTGELVAVKIVRSGDEEIQETVKRTFTNTRCLKHPNIIRNIELYINKHLETSYMVMEYCSFPSLESIILKRTLSNEELRFVFKQLLMAVQHSHSKGICHRDIKPDNVLIDIDEKSQNVDKVKLVDFGVSRRFINKGQEVELLTKTGNIFYCAPEIYHSSSYSKEVDIWAIGVMLYQSIFQELPLYDDDINTFIDLLKQTEKWNFKQKLQQIDMPLQNLVLSMLTPDRHNRLTAEEALKHPFFQIGTINDVKALINSTHQQAIECLRCKSLHNSLQANKKWGFFIQKLENSLRNEDVNIDSLLEDLGDIHIIQKHSEQCAAICLINSYQNSANTIMSKLDSHQEFLERSSSNGSAKKEQLDKFNQIFRDGYISIENSLEIKENTNQHQVNAMFQALGAHMDQSIEVTSQANCIQKKPSVNSMMADLGIKEVDEITEDF